MPSAGGLGDLLGGLMGGGAGGASGGMGGLLGGLLGGMAGGQTDSFGGGGGAMLPLPEHYPRSWAFRPRWRMR
ncbi:MAG: hypothetical protein R3C44_01855 [Chloroflexota bacterium]